MEKHHRRLFILIFLGWVLTNSPVLAYEILLDIDTDNDPATINNSNDDSSAVVKVVLRPTVPDETIGLIYFCIGGECLGCPPNDINGVHTYGTSFDLPVQGPWVTAQGFDSEAAYATLLGCPDNPGCHLMLSLEPQDGGTMILDHPIFLAQFNAWVSGPVPDGCAQPSSNLMAMPGQGEWWNYILIGGAEGPNNTQRSTWGRIKKIHQ
jgi:hypothetical protein